MATWARHARWATAPSSCWPSARPRRPRPSGTSRWPVVRTALGDSASSTGPGRRSRRGSTRAADAMRRRLSPGSSGGHAFRRLHPPRGRMDVLDLARVAKSKADRDSNARVVATSGLEFRGKRPLPRPRSRADTLWHAYCSWEVERRAGAAARLRFAPFLEQYLPSGFHGARDVGPALPSLLLPLRSSSFATTGPHRRRPRPRAGPFR